MRKFCLSARKSTRLMKTITLLETREVILELRCCAVLQILAEK